MTHQVILAPTYGNIALWRDPVDIAARLDRTRRMAIAGLIVFVTAMVAISTVVPAGGAVVGQGQLGVESRVKQVTHPTGGVIKSILVHDGQQVAKGQLMIQLDSEVSGLSASLAGQTVEQLLAQRARLMAERENAPAISFPDDLVRANTSSAREAMASEQRLFDLRRTERANMRSQLGQRIVQFEQQIASYRAQIVSLDRQRILIEPERKGVKDLWGKGLVTINRLNQLERSAVDLDGSIASIDGNIAQTRARISEAREQMLAVDQNARADAGKELAQVNATLNDQQAKSVSASDAFSRTEIRAPYAGTVDKLAFATVGGVISPAQTIMEIVPQNERLLVEASIDPADIGKVHTGQAARVRLSAFSAPTTPEIPGTVVFVSPERTTDPKTGASYFRVHVRLDESVLKKERMTLKPGMPAEIFVSSGERTLMSYILKPLRDQFARAFRN